MRPNSIFPLLIAAAIMLSCGEVEKNKKGVQTEQKSTTPVEINNDGVFISHKRYGEGQFTLLFVHGWCINQTYWSKQVEALSSKYSIVTVDLPGFGESGTNRENWSIEAYGGDIDAVIEQLKLRNVILIGHSMGGDVILEAALKNEEVIALIGVDNFKDVGIKLSDEEIAEIEGFLKMLENNFWEIAPAYAEGTLFHPSTDSLVKERVKEDFKNSDAEIAVSSLKALFQYASVESQRLLSLKQKLYLINSDASPTHLDGLKATGIDYELVEINATGHYPMIEKPQEFNVLLKQTIEKIETEHNRK